MCLLSVLVLPGCNNEYAPKPMGYIRMDRTDYSYGTLYTNNFSFQYSGLAHIDTIPSPDKNNLWFNIVYPQYTARLHCSYFPISKHTLRQAIEDSYQLAYSHAIKADGINQALFSNEIRKVSGIIYDIDGNVATPIQFFLTDSVSNFFRASFYYDTKVKSDSVLPVTQFVREDIVRLIESFEWINK